jgi:antitoxin component HigA of HigAB toxin-antitoxin module
MHRITQIETEDDYRDALKRFMHLCESDKTDEEIEEMFLLIDIMEKYERANCSQN